MSTATLSTHSEQPLADLHEVLEDDEESKKFLADPIWWRCVDQIDRRRILNPKSAEYKNLRIMFSEVTFYIFFLIVLTMLVHTSQGALEHETREHQLRYWASCSKGATKCGIRSVTDVRTFWSWMVDDLIQLSEVQPLEKHAPAFMMNGQAEDVTRAENIRSMQTTFPSNDFTVNHRAAVLSGPSAFTIILGPIRVRQLRVDKNKGCDVSKLYRQLISNCYSKFTEGHTESREFFGSSQTPSYIIPAFEWADASQTGGAGITSGGILALDTASGASYPGSGFFFDLPHNSSSARSMLVDLQESYWIDAATRAIVVEIPTLSPNTRVVTTTRILFEFNPTERVSSFPVHALSISAGHSEEAAALLLQILTLLVLTVSATWIVWQIKRLGVARYFAYGWNVVDVVITLLLTCYLAYKIQTYVGVASTEALSSEKIGHPDYFPPLAAKAGVPLEKAATILSCICLLAWTKLYKYLALWSPLRMLVQILLRSTRQLLVFGALLVIVVFTGFSLAFYAGLGSIVPEYSNITHAFATAVFSLMMSLRIDPKLYVPGNDTVGTLLTVCYVLVVYFVTVPMFTAIVLNAFYHDRGCEKKVDSTTSRPASRGAAGPKLLEGNSRRWRHSLGNLWSMEKDVERRNPMAVFLYTLYKSLRGASVDFNHDEDFGLPEEQDIQLKLLPGIVAQRWFERKRRLSYLVDKNLRRESQRDSTDDSRATSAGTGSRDSSAKDIGVVTKLLERTREALHIPSATEFQPELPSQVTENSDVRGPNPTDLYLLDKSAVERTTVSRAQLQRLMDEDRALPLLLGTTRAIDVIRRFKFPDDNPEISHPVDKGPGPVAQLQEDWYRKLDRLEKTGLGVETRENPFCRQLMTELDRAIDQMHNVWRDDLRSLLEVVGNLAEELLELIKSLDTAKANYILMLDNDAEHALAQLRRKSTDSVDSSDDHQ
ncbi:Polycystic kidney disease [Perkinsus olseni]|uniref:Polycystic kidney disease n=1 Tax=Perkinsus olseni TaxID=32597 RepID=A0A7J6QH09_PEROL|nr:Polycystic kidney disease [Perkinsus olseni]